MRAAPDRASGPIAVRPPPRAGHPDVTVVVIVYDDAERLPVAVASVLDQTLHNLEVVVVDDHSSDSTPEVVAGLVAADPRVRNIRLPENSGGCSRPRNVGLEHARAPYVMFLDSDDELERHACKNLLTAAERHGADVVSGICHQVYRKSRRVKAWWPFLYEERAVYHGIEERPDLLFDTLSTNKLYLKSFLDEFEIRFPEGYHWEDLLFSTEVYCLARTIALIPNLVYRWNFAETTDNPSISNRRRQIANFEHRVAILRMIDDYLAEHGRDELRKVKDRRVIRHDLRLYLFELPFADADFQRDLLDVGARYLEGVDESVLDDCDPIDRVVFHAVLTRDLGLALSAVDFLKHGRKLSSALVCRDGRVYWADKGLDTPEARRRLDVTDLQLHKIPFGRADLYNRLEELRVSQGARAVLQGTLLDQLGRLSPDDALGLELTMWARRSGRRKTVPIRDWHRDGAWLRWSVQVDLADVVKDARYSERVWYSAVRVRRGDEWAMAPLTVTSAALEGFTVPVEVTRWGAMGNRLQTYRTANANLAFTLAAGSRVGEVGYHVLQRAKRSPVGGVAKRAVRELHSPSVQAAAFKAFQRLPVRRGTVFFESHMGKQFSDSPRYVYEALRRMRPGYRAVWSYERSPAGFPRDALLLRRDTLRWAYELARAGYWVDNQGFPRIFTKRRETTYVQTWHGTPLKSMGFDEPAIAGLPPEEQREYQAMIDRWDVMPVPSEYYVETLVRAYNFAGELLRVGLPRNDALLRPPDAEAVKALKVRLQIPLDKKIVLYAPTFREEQRRLGKTLRLPFGLDRLQAGLGDDHHLLVRTHYLTRLAIPARFRPFVTDVSRYHDITELLLLTDVLVTDYSSVMFDFANLRRPMVFYAYDYLNYVREERGTYVDLAEIAPGPLVTDEEQLVAAIREIDTTVDKYAERYDAFVARFCGYETGHAAEAIVERCFPERQR